jgi:pimeloyl-ACP methyl ester carboxylesterase
VVSDGPAVLISHGIIGGIDAEEYLATNWRNLEEDYRFIYVSRFGYLGSSLPEDATPRLQAAAYRDLLDHLGIERKFMVANSAGGAAGMRFAIDYPERRSGLILLSSSVLRSARRPDRRFVAKREFIIENAYMASLPISERTEGIQSDKEVSNPAINDVPFERIKTPTLIFQSVDDPRELEGAREMERRIPHNEYIGLTGGHFLLRHQSEIRTMIAEFIAEHAEQGRRAP